MLRLEALRAERECALVVVDSLPTPVRVAAPAQRHAHEVAGDLLAIRRQVMVAHEQVAMLECKVAESNEWVRMEVIHGSHRNGAESPKRVATPVERATAWLQIAELFVAPRIAREEIGDLLEMIHRLEREGRPAWHIYVRAITGVFFTMWHSWGEKLAALKKISG
jgi:hypothetical protein